MKKQDKEKLIDITKINSDFMYLHYFIKYPYDYLKEFSKEIDDNKHKMTIDNIKRVIYLLEVDIFCLTMGLKNGIHPITGLKFKTDRRIVEAENLIRRNHRWIDDLQDIIIYETQNTQTPNKKLDYEVFKEHLKSHHAACIKMSKPPRYDTLWDFMDKMYTYKCNEKKFLQLLHHAVNDKIIIIDEQNYGYQFLES